MVSVFGLLSHVVPILGLFMCRTSTIHKKRGLCKNSLTLKERQSSGNFSAPSGAAEDGTPPQCSPKKFGICNQTITLITGNQSPARLQTGPQGDVPKITGGIISFFSYSNGFPSSSMEIILLQPDNASDLFLKCGLNVKFGSGETASGAAFILGRKNKKKKKEKKCDFYEDGAPVSAGAASGTCRHQRWRRCSKHCEVPFLHQTRGTEPCRSARGLNQWVGPERKEHKL